MDSNEILHCLEQMDKLNAERNYSDMLVLLRDLDKQHVSAKQLQTTDIVKVLYQILKSCKDDTVRKTVRRVLARWRREFGKQRDLEPEPCGNTEASDTGVDLKQQEGSSNPDHVNLSENVSSIRSKCVELLLSAICLQPSDREKASKLSECIENNIYDLHKSNTPKYKRCVRSKISNLRNPKSGYLREGLLNESILPQVFAQMSTEEMASPDLKQLRREYSVKSVSERQLPGTVDGTATTKVRCRRCGGMDCKVTQVSRGALFLPAWVRQSGPDHDSMTFVTCSSCGQQWYLSNWVCL
ncbi:unnamed protein product [Knipowitschia caucasica]